MSRPCRLVGVLVLAVLAFAAGSASADDPRLASAADRADAPPAPADSDGTVEEFSASDPEAAEPADRDGVLTLPSGEQIRTRYPAIAYTGIARFVWDDGRSYSGDFVDGLPHGHGIEQLPDGSRYEGGWAGGHRDGEGSLVLADGSRYDGTFASGARSGKGLFQSAVGRYEGDWANDVPDGEGRFDYVDGASYQGEWSGGRRSGFGTYRRPDGSHYEGDWQNDMPDGSGELVEPDGYTYEGGWSQGQRSGYGAVRIGDTFGYEGTWAADVRQGFGREIRPDGGDYTGEWRDDERSGHGMLHAPNGARHDGEWQHNVPFGAGTRTSAEGVEITGQWDGDVVSNGTIRMRSGREYRGDLYDSKLRSVAPAFVQWLERIANGGDADAAMLVGQAYRFFDQPAPDRTKAIVWYGRAAEAGIAEAQYQLAELLLEDSATAQRGLEWLRRAAAQGHGSANTRLGVFFQLGTYVQKSHSEAQHYYEVATVQGDLTARNNLAWLLATSPSADLRNGGRAVALAQPLAVLYETWGYLDTLAAAQAEAGDFPAAARSERRAMDLAHASSTTTAMALQELQRRLTLFERDEPYREP